MNKTALGLLMALCPLLAFAADGSLSFAPPPSDYSVVFLGNIFGIVDGVLHGTGSQIMGSIFAVFNAAVLALGGMVIMYTLLVSTMNTAHEGQMLGQKWSSIWIPVRSTLGLALLIPKASGYCLMQIFVMWIVVQGVGAADKVWDAALSYLNRGGVIIQGQMDPTTSLTGAKTAGSAGGAQYILAGQTCMLGLQKQLELQRQGYLSFKSKGGGPCYGTPTGDMEKFCNTAVPDFVNSVNIVSIQSADPNAKQGSNAYTYKADMPNFQDGLYAGLNGVCGTVTWNPYTFTADASKITSITSSDMETAKMSRAIAIQQMYLDLTNVAQVMVNNDPELVKQGTGSSTPYAVMASQQFGVPTTASGTPCANSSTTNCISWGQAAGASSSAPLFNGTEFQGAITDYNGIMLPTLNLNRQAADAASANSSRQFIQQATTQGWIMAGSYFFNLVNLNQQASGGGGLTDSTGTGLDASSFKVKEMTNGFTGSGSSMSCSGTPAGSVLLCNLFNKNKDAVVKVQRLINATDSPYGVVEAAKMNTPLTTVADQRSSTVYGYTTNSMILQLPGQPGQQPLEFANLIHITVDTSTLQLPSVDIACHGTVWTGGCIVAYIGDMLYNDLLRTVFNFLLGTFHQVINQVIMTFLTIPLQGMALIFKQGLAIIATPGVNPVVALANMGTYYINFAGNLWIMIIEISIRTELIPYIGLFIFALIALVMPILVAWLGIMVSIGFVTAFYVPVLPYMIFTFGAIAWLMAVIEAMVAAPIVALGVTHPEGHDAFGKGEQAIMILMNIFLRPSMMIIGYIAAISLSYVGVWILNAGFDNAIGFIQGSSEYGTKSAGTFNDIGNMWASTGSVQTGAGGISGGYTGWAGVFAFFFSILIYTTMYLTIVQKSFTLISMLPDKVLRWIGGQPESIGEQSAGWGDENVKGKIGEAGKETSGGQAAMDKQLGGYAAKGGAGMKKAISGSSGGSAEGKGNTGPNSTPSSAGEVG